MKFTVLRIVTRSMISQTSQFCTQSQHATKHTEIKLPSVYKTLYPWRTLSEFTNTLVQSVVHNRDGLICINKPYGVGIRRYKENAVKNISSTLFVNSIDESPYTLEDSLPGIRTVLGEDNLILVKTPGRYATGLVLLATSEKVKSTISASLVRTKAMQRFPYSILNVGIGELAKEEHSERVGISLMSLNEKQTEKQPIIHTEFSKNKVKDEQIKPVSVKYSAVSKNGDWQAILMETATTQLKWHFVRVYSAHKGVAILGDNLYGSRVKWVLGKPVNISIYNNASHELPILPRTITNALGISSEEVQYIPTHMHLQKVNLLKFHNQDITISAPLPSYFIWSCNALKIPLPDHFVNNENTLQ